MIKNINQLFSVIPVNVHAQVKYPWSEEILIRLVLETIMRLSLISVLVIAFSATSLVSAGPIGSTTTAPAATGTSTATGSTATGSTTTGSSTGTTGLSGNDNGVCIVYAINANDWLIFRLGAGVTVDSFSDHCFVARQKGTYTLLSCMLLTPMVDLRAATA